MTLHANTELGKGGAGMHGTDDKSAAAMIKELQGLTVNLVDGAAATTNIAVAGIATEDTLLSVIEFSAAGLPVDRTSVASITSAGNIQLTQTSAGNKLQVMWFNKR